MEADEFTELEYKDEYYYLKTIVRKDGGQFPIFTSMWMVFDSKGNQVIVALLIVSSKGNEVVIMQGKYPESKACDPEYIEDMIDNLMKVVRGKIYLHYHGVSEHDLEGQEYEEFLRYMNEERVE